MLFNILLSITIGAWNPNIENEVEFNKYRNVDVKYENEYVYEHCTTSDEGFWHVGQMK